MGRVRFWRVDWSAGPRYSAVIARSTSIFAARRAGQTAASTPTTAASTTKISNWTSGTFSTLMPWSEIARCRLIPKISPNPMPSTAPEHRDGHRLQPDHRPELTPAHPDGAQQPDLPGPFDDRQGQGVDDAEDRDDHRQPEQRVDDAEQLIDRCPLVRGEGVLVLDRDGRQIGQDALDPGLDSRRIGPGGCERRRRSSRPGTTPPASSAAGGSTMSDPMNGLASMIPTIGSCAGPAGRPTVIESPTAQPCAVARSLTTITPSEAGVQGTGVHGDGHHLTHRLTVEGGDEGLRAADLRGAEPERDSGRNALNRSDLRCDGGRERRLHRIRDDVVGLEVGA